jgi:hypothetical protein
MAKKLQKLVSDEARGKGVHGGGEQRRLPLPTTTIVVISGSATTQSRSSMESGLPPFLPADGLAKILDTHYLYLNDPNFQIIQPGIIG